MTTQSEYSAKVGRSRCRVGNIIMKTDCHIATEHHSIVILKM
jgi:hypothetical protein